MPPRRKPTALKLLEGDRKDRINTHEPRTHEGPPEPPEELSPLAAEVWRYITQELAYMRLASPSDRDALACYCEAVAIHRKASADLANQSLMLKGRDVAQVKNPLVQIQRDSAQTIKSFAVEFGLTPSSRAGMKAPESSDPREDLLS